MKISTEHLVLTYLHPFAIARRAPMTERVFLLVKIEHGGVTGFGTASPSLYYGGETLERTEAVVLESQQFLGNDPSQIEAVMARLVERFPDAPAARAAVDMALHDWIGKQAGMPLVQYWGLDPTIIPPTSYTIGIDTVPRMLEKLKQAAGFPNIKIKVGFDGDLDVVRAIREHTDARLRVDANTGWGVEEAVERINQMAAYDIELIEQPIPAGNYEGLRYIRENVDIPIMADEDARTAAELPALAGCVDMINIKLMKCGGLLEARRMIEQARQLDLKIMLGCMGESTVGITAAAHLAPLVDYTDLDAPLLSSETVFEGVEYDGARLQLPLDRPGIGVVRKPESR